jgi:hypothetical protein
MDWQNWLPIVISGIFVAFGAALWLWIRNLIKKMGDSLEKGFRVADYQLEKWIGLPNSIEAWKSVVEFGKMIQEKAQLMIDTQSFQPSSGNTGGDSRTITDVSKAVNKQNTGNN